MVVQNELSLMDKLRILSDSAKYDAACTSSGITRKNNGRGIGNSLAWGICHSFSADGRCISLLKILMSNECIFNCRYCINRSSNDLIRTSFTPEEICTLTMEFYRRNYIEGLFLSSGIMHSPDHTMQLMLETVMLLRTRFHFGGYIHLKGIPGASGDLIEAAGWYADRMSVNLELPTAEGLRQLAPNKSRKTILGPMRLIQRGIQNNARTGLTLNSTDALPDRQSAVSRPAADPFSEGSLSRHSSFPAKRYNADLSKPSFVPAGQSTQMIIGATDESDYHIVSVAEALYRNYGLKRVFYSAFVNVNHDSSLPQQPDGKGVPLLREHRLYQADWLMRYYGFESRELLSESSPYFNVLLDPKCDWALRHLDQFPVEVNKADYYTLLRVPGIGVRSARRIIQARRMARLDFDGLKKMGVVLKRAIYFITCCGKPMYPIKLDADSITNALAGEERRRTFELEDHGSYKQLSLFDDRMPLA